MTTDITGMHVVTGYPYGAGDYGSGPFGGSSSTPRYDATAQITANNGAGASTPVDALGYETTRQGRNVIHDTIDGGLAVVLIAPRPRSGTLELLYLNEADAAAALALHGEETTFTITGARALLAMTYVVAGSVSLRLDEETRDLWILAVEYQEVAP